MLYMYVDACLEARGMQQTGRGIDILLLFSHHLLGQMCLEILRGT